MRLKALILDDKLVDEFDGSQVFFSSFGFYL